MCTRIGVVVIGRNEGKRLVRCLQSVIRQTDRIVYVDSGSTDESVAYAASQGIDVVELDMSIPFSAGRARNEGFNHLVNKHPDLVHVQFFDGDCELIEGWIGFARQHLDENSSWAVVAGRRQERHPEQSIYNRLCDMEWNTPVGEAKACGGDFMIRIIAFQAVKGFNPAVIAGEEPELCYRLRQIGWKIHRLDHLMTLHDAAITRFSQWWRRAVRSGYAYAQGYALHGREKEKYCLRDSLRIWFWAFMLPFIIALSTLIFDIDFIVLFLIYPLNLAKMAIKDKKNFPFKLLLIYYIFNILGKAPQLVGQFLYATKFFKKNKQLIIEYK